MSDVVRLRIDRPAHGGESIGLLDGRVVLVRGAIPGELVDVALDDPGAKLLRGAVAGIEEASPHRIDGMCDAAAAGAGCCDLDFVDPAHAAVLKGEVVADALRRIGRIPADAVPDIAVTALSPATGWRTRLRLGVDRRGRAGLRRRKSRELVTGVVCAQTADGLMAGLGEEGAAPAGGELHAVLDADGRRHLLHRAAPERGVRGRRRRRPAATVVEGSATAPMEAGGRRFDVAVDGFWQAHAAAADHYVDVVRSWLPEVPGGVAWDLYGGVGVLAAPLAELVRGDGADGRVVSVEAFPQAARAGRDSLHDLPVEFVTARVEYAVAGRADLVVLDPPRTGAGAEVVAAVAAAGPSHVLHIGCDPATFARDAAAWLGAGYRLERIEAVDAFPGTHHVETLALFVRGDAQVNLEG
ncbi:class I SAM-dependent RNA methyltransferase [Corynebacterium sp. 335C]